MISEFQQLSQKIDQLAELASALRLENAGLRRQLTAVSGEHAACQVRMRAAQERLAALIAHLPEPEAEAEAEAEEGDEDEAGAAEQEAA